MHVCIFNYLYTIYKTYCPHCLENYKVNFFKKFSWFLNQDTLPFLEWVFFTFPGLHTLGSYIFHWIESWHCCSKKRIRSEINFMEPTVMSAKHDLFEVGERCEITPLAVQTKINMPSFYIRILKLSFFRLRLLMYPCIKFLQILNYWHNLCAETSSK